MWLGLSLWPHQNLLDSSHTNIKKEYLVEVFVAIFWGNDCLKYVHVLLMSLITNIIHTIHNTRWRPRVERCCWYWVKDYVSTTSVYRSVVCVLLQLLLLLVCLCDDHTCKRSSRVRVHGCMYNTCTCIMTMYCSHMYKPHCMETTGSGVHWMWHDCNWAIIIFLTAGSVWNICCSGGSCDLRTS